MAAALGKLGGGQFIQGGVQGQGFSPGQVKKEVFVGH